MSEEKLLLSTIVDMFYHQQAPTVVEEDLLVVVDLLLRMEQRVRVRVRVETSGKQSRERVSRSSHLLTQFKAHHLMESQPSTGQGHRV